MSFLLWKKAIGVVAACLRPDLNPDAPRIVLPGHGRFKEQAADWLSDHPKHAIPVFVKRDQNKWEYVGRYRCERWTDDKNEIQKWKPASRSDPIYRVLFLRTVE